MNRVEIVKRQLENLKEELNKTIGWEKITFDQQDEVKKHMRLIGGNGSMWVSPNTLGIDVSISGGPGEKQLYPEFVKLLGRKHKGYKQTKPEPRQAYWRVDSFADVKAAAEIYAKTDK